MPEDTKYAAKLVWAGIRPENNGFENLGFGIDPEKHLRI